MTAGVIFSGLRKGLCTAFAAAIPSGFTGLSIFSLVCGSDFFPDRSSQMPSGLPDLCNP